jgi:hypothetical protein
VETLAWLRCRVNRRKIARWLGASLGVLAATAGGAAVAAPAARERVLALLGALAKQPEAASVASESIAKASDALRRADQMRAAGDQTHGALLEDAAVEWAEASDLLSKTAASERQLGEAQARTTELETKVFRTQALVEQTVARRARAEEALRKLGDKAGKP